ncbi:SAM-dependent methyltransferase [Thermobispora bispora]|uniref:SAM-dependent methyltransferase n=1 Tax=Thermobispora bispora TaxID=2006 RepID=UPI001F11CAB1|nr:SAM-dependent methyltransferase [Thermobispora bispora]
MLLVAVLHFIPDEAAYPAVATLRDRLAPGSHLVISHVSAGNLDEKTVEKGRQIYSQSQAGMAVPRPREDIERFFEGFELLRPGPSARTRWAVYGRPRRPALSVRGHRFTAGGPRDHRERDHEDPRQVQDPERQPERRRRPVDHTADLQGDEEVRCEQQPGADAQRRRGHEPGRRHHGEQQQVHDAHDAKRGIEAAPGRGESGGDRPGVEEPHGCARTSRPGRAGCGLRTGHAPHEQHDEHDTGGRERPDAHQERGRSHADQPGVAEHVADPAQQEGHHQQPRAARSPDPDGERRRDEKRRDERELRRKPEEDERELCDRGEREDDEPQASEGSARGVGHVREGGPGISNRMRRRTPRRSALTRKGQS